MTFRAATAGDAPALARTLGDWVRETGWMPVLHTREEDVEFLRHLIATCEVWVVGEDEPQGFLARDGEEIQALYLSPSARSHGLGRSLLDRAKQDRARLSLWAFEANSRALAFYEREGFRVVERTAGEANEERLPDLRLIWEAAP